jgi:hypothetical protein
MAAMPLDAVENLAVIQLMLGSNFRRVSSVQERARADSTGAG